jgi:hypothetical protein
MKKENAFIVGRSPLPWFTLVEPIRFLGYYSIAEFYSSEYCLYNYYNKFIIISIISVIIILSKKYKEGGF